ncbi:MAG: hypothetical protein QXN55_08870 [Candidatus Nitrosotenuis sp.]|jgi:hypothetical protein
MQKDISEYMKRHIELLLDQTKSYQPFIKTAFPTTNMSDACFNLIAANAFSVFLGQYAMRMIVPTQADFAEFGTLVSQYREKINEIFAK